MVTVSDRQGPADQQDDPAGAALLASEPTPESAWVASEGLPFGTYVEESRSGYRVIFVNAHGRVESLSEPVGGLNVDRTRYWSLSLSRRVQQHG